MKNICLLSLLVICLSGCIDQPSENPAAESSTKETQENKNDATEKTNSVDVIKTKTAVEEPVTRPEDEEFLDITDSLDRPEPEKMPFLITNDAIGPFAFEGNIDSVLNLYGWIGEEEIKWFDGCAFPTRVIHISENQDVILSYKLAFDTRNKNEKPYSKYPDKYIFVESDNCNGFYFKNISESISETCEIFKTREGIHVGSTFKELHDAYPDLIYNYGDADGECFNNIEVKGNSGVTFFFDCDALFDVTRNCREENGSNYRPDAPVVKISISKPYEWE